MSVSVKGVSQVDGRTVDVRLSGGSAEELAARVSTLEGKVSTLETQIQDHETRLAALEAVTP